MPNLLLISYHFGPRTATGGFRWTQLAPLLVERGWQLDVLTHDDIQDTEARAAIRAHHVEATAPWRAVAAVIGGGPGLLAHGLRRVRGRVSTSTASPAALTVNPAAVRVPVRGQAPPLRQVLVRGLDGLAEETRMLGWASAASRAALQLATKQAYAAVVVSTPPHATLRAGIAISQRTGLPFVADLRDPWVLGIGESRENMNLAHRWLGDWMEPRMNDAAAAVVHNTDIERRALDALLPRARTRRAYIPNGHDLTTPPAVPSSERFTLVYTGHLHPWMDPRPFLAACQRFLATNSAAHGVTDIVFMGTPREFGGVDLQALAAAYGLSDCFDLRPRGGRDAANALQESASVLVAYDCTHPHCVPAKFFDYAYMRGVMLLIGHPEGAMAEMAQPLGIPVIPPDDGPGFDKVLATAFSRWQSGDWRLQNDHAGIYARPRQADAWDALLREVAGLR